ncbi:alpha/beta hydrolase [Streptomyces sp. NPDC093272]|uniref:alpha/beta fold hydrolase n=1 Tax=Streptomyces sp. NPDC093272 TaxID=3154981 RepID=UPI003416CD65
MTDGADVRFFPSRDGDLAYLDTGSAYLDTGSGDPVVLIHSGYVDHRMWADQIPALAAGHRVIAPDVRGHGSSANASEPFRWADDLAALLRHLDAGPAVLVGVSMGGVIATDTVLEHPGLVRAVVTCGAATGDFRYSDAWHTELGAEYARSLGAGDIEGWLDAFVRVAAGARREVADLDPEIPRRLREMARRTLARHTPGETDWHVPVTGSWPRLPKIDVPVLTINGGLEPAELLAAAERLAREVPDGRAEVVEGTDHYPNLERPDVFNGLLLDFLRAL